MGIKRQIILCMDDLDQLPETSFEKDIVCEDQEAFCLSKDNIASLKLLLGQVRMELIQYVIDHSECFSLSDTLQCLCRMNKVDLLTTTIQ